MPSPTRPVLDFKEPMLLKPTGDLPAGADWLYEVKWDGYRVLAVKDRAQARLFSRRGNSLTRTFPTIVDAVLRLPCKQAMLDGEIVGLDSAGRPSFQSLQRRSSAQHGVVGYFFDLLVLDRKDLRSLPLASRRAELETLLENSDLRVSRLLEGSPAALIEHARALQLEGLVAKRRKSQYEHGERSGAWVKVKLGCEQELVVGGYEPGPPLESLIVGYWEGRELKYAGRVRNGMTSLARRELEAKLAKLKIERSPFVEIPVSKRSRWGEGIAAGQFARVKWVKPKLVVQVGFTEWTVGGVLRHSYFKGLRPDIDARRVIRERTER